MLRFRRRGRPYSLITMDTPLEELEGFFDAHAGGSSGVEESAAGGKQDFAIVTHGDRKFVLGIATRGDLEEFVKRRPGPSPVGGVAG